MQHRPLSFHLIRIPVLLLVAYILFGASAEVQRVAWGTGNWLGEYSLKWGMGFFAFVVFCFLIFLLSVVAAYFPQKLPSDFLAHLRARLGLFCWPLILLVLLAPIWIFQYTYWGVVFTGASFRILIWAITTIIIAYLLASSSILPITTCQLLIISLLLTGTTFAAAMPFVNVTSYPFSLSWSEGNRLWDYSIMFGRHLYNYPANQPLFPFLDFGRQLVGGLPFLLPHVTIAGERLWVALMAVVPYLLLGWAAFAGSGAKPSLVFLAGLWSFLFLNQGPIHPPLIFSAWLVALTWRRPLWISIPALALASWFAAVSRFTWMFAPGMWAGMLVLADEFVRDGQAGPSARTWGHAILLGLVGAASGYFLPQLGLVQSQGVTAAASDALFGQSLLWYRLLPNKTYHLGILLNLAIAVLPLIAVMIFLVARKEWKLSFWQRLAIVLPLLAFLVVGLIASTKIGGGADLHNLDMFFIGTLFAASLAWRRLVPQWDRVRSSSLLMAGLVLMIFLPSLGALQGMQPLLRADEMDRLKVLMGREDVISNNPNILGLLPAGAQTERALKVIRSELDAASKQGEVLFMDQRQLLTFGLVDNLPLVPAYDKKYLMDRSMTNTFLPVFQSFYADLAAHRFAMIVTDPLHTPVKDSDYSFGEENNAWVKWVARPVLCFYTPKVDLNEFHIQLLVPRTDASVCDLPK